MNTRIIFGPIRCRISLDEIERQNDDRRLIKNIWFREMLNTQIYMIKMFCCIWRKFDDNWPIVKRQNPEWQKPVRKISRINLLKIRSNVIGPNFGA